MQSPSEFLDDAAGKSLTTLAKRGVGGWLLALSATIITGMQSIAKLLLFPINAITDIGHESVTALILKPLGIVGAGAGASATGAAQFGLFGLPVATSIVLVTFAMVALYLAWPQSGNILPGLPFDVPTPFFQGAEEDQEES